MTYLTNSFSINMLGFQDKEKYNLSIRKITLDEAKNILSRGFTSAIGHSSTANFLNWLFNGEIEVKENRINLKVSNSDIIVVFQLLQRLEEGKILTEEELEQINYSFFLVRING